MAHIIPTKKHILVKRARIMKFLREEGYDDSEIAIIFNEKHRSYVGRIIAAEKKYRGLVKEILSDKKS